MEKPKLALIPATIGSKVFSVLPSDGSGDFDFTRASAATRINKDGLIETITSSVSRLNYPLIDGVVSGCPSLLLEPQRTNLVTYSEDFSNAYWTKAGSSVTSGFVSPSGDLSAFKLTEDTSSNHQMYRAISGTNKTLSFFAKSDGRDWVAINCGSLTYFNVALGTVGTVSAGSVATIESMPNGWFRCSVTETSGAYGADFSLSKDGTTTSYQGDGTSGVYIFGAQIEQGSYPTSYIPTNGTTVTRLADTANGAGDASTFNDSEGVLMAEISAFSETGSAGLISLSDGTNSNRITIELDGNIVKGRLTPSVGVLNASTNITISTKIALKYKENDFALWVNGLEVAVSNSGNTFSNGTLTELSFNRGDSAENFYGNVKDVRLYNTALTDLELQQLTTI